MSVTRRRLLAGLMASAAAPLYAEAPVVSPLPRRRGDGGETRTEPVSPARLIEAAGLGGAVGFVVADAETGEVIEAHDGDRTLPPASVLKTVTAAFALDRLGPEKRFETRILATGDIGSDGVLNGDLILAGGGDPVLDTDMLGDLAAKVVAAGVRGVHGRFVIWDGALPRLQRIDAEQPEFVGYNPALGGLNLNFNRVHFEWRRAGADWRLTMDARAERFVPKVHMARISVERRNRPLFTYRADGDGDVRTVASGALGKGGSRWLPVRHPAHYAGDVFRALIAAHGIELAEPVYEPVPPDARLIARHHSAPLDRILEDMLKYSTNLTAEVAGLTASQAATLRGSALVMQEWMRLHHGIAAQFADHSGLGGDLRLSTAGMVRLLVQAGGGMLPGMLKDYGMRDEAGKVIRGHPVEVRAKTGTLNFVSTLAGYVMPPGGRRLAFAIFCGDVERRAALPRSQREQPEGGFAWKKRARKLQSQLIARWAVLHA